MPQVIGFGEVLLDILAKDGKVMKAQVGGSVLNTLVSLARSGYETSIISEVGPDAPGSIIIEFLTNEGIAQNLLSISTECQTALAFALLNASGDASYSFYKRYPVNRFAMLEFKPDRPGYFAFGSTLALDEKVQTSLQVILNKAEEKQFLICYDPNIRQVIGSQSRQVDIALSHLRRADVVRGSHEDFEQLFGSSNIESVSEKIDAKHPQLLIITSAEHTIQLKFQNQNFYVDPPVIQVVNTIGAGDAFNAGVIAYLIDNGFTKSNLTTLTIDHLHLLCQKAISFSSIVCQESESYLPRRG